VSKDDPRIILGRLRIAGASGARVIRRLPAAATVQTRMERISHFNTLLLETVKSLMS